MKYHTKQWFLNRVGKRIYRLTKYKCCQHCDDSFENGIVVNDAFHAGCLFDYQNEMGYEYGDENIITHCLMGGEVV